ncbi:DnaT-like ssDNA-binding domain-containing protein [Pseudomonas arsenicoxydans]|uniref:DnaT-like ssDNA-binding domain-containing protein n=1 Tax=Pseudomonas arsenicoxydans TaxID=702115 RepID=UPI001F0230E7|nr:DnaT-like ssDNA-binding domain-containing protein [Pseudomonas arsenicoxydans]
MSIEFYTSGLLVPLFWEIQIYHGCAGHLNQEIPLFMRGSAVWTNEMPAFQINDDEREALRGLPHTARLIYVFGLRPFMDYSTGIVGVKRGVSWKSIAEELYVEPHQGIRGGEPTEKELRRAAAWLEKVGLIGPNQAERRLVFELLKATRDQSVRNKVGSKWADEVGSFLGREVGVEVEGANPNSYAAFKEEVGANVGKEVGIQVVGGGMQKVGTPPLSALPPSSSPSREEQAPLLRFAMSESWLPTPEGLEEVLFLYQVSAEANTDARLREFKLYWASRPEKIQSQGQWELELAESLERNVLRQKHAEAMRATRSAGAIKPSATARCVTPARTVARPNLVCDLAKQSHQFAEEAMSQVREIQGISGDGVEARKQLLAKFHLRGDRSHA